VEPDRFDDVAFRIVEDPLPPRRPPRARRWLLAFVACVLVTGALAGGASALSGDDARFTAAPWPKTDADIGYLELYSDGPCRDGKPHHGERERSSALQH
jgi:hypothetical protein